MTNIRIQILAVGSIAAANCKSRIVLGAKTDEI